jgi:hypothetical protein
MWLQERGSSIDYGTVVVEDDRLVSVMRSESPVGADRCPQLTPLVTEGQRRNLGAGDDHSGADREPVEEECHGRVRDVHAAVARVRPVLGALPECVGRLAWVARVGTRGRVNGYSKVTHPRPIVGLSEESRDTLRCAALGVRAAGDPRPPDLAGPRQPRRLRPARHLRLAAGQSPHPGRGR